MYKICRILKKLISEKISEIWNSARTSKKISKVITVFDFKNTALQYSFARVPLISQIQRFNSVNE